MVGVVVATFAGNAGSCQRDVIYGDGDWRWRRLEHDLSAFNSSKARVGLLGSTVGLLQTTDWNGRILTALQEM